jgi:hypothetical protein
MLLTIETSYIVIGQKRKEQEEHKQETSARAKNIKRDFGSK